MLEANVTTRQQLVRQYQQSLGKLRGIRFQQVQAGNTCSQKDLSLRIVAREFGSNRDAVRAALTAAGIETRTYFAPPVHQQTAYRPWRAATGKLPVTEQVASEVLNLPLFTAITNQDLRRVVAVVEACAAKPVAV
jgi:dTDP-4-amino-4,6-dideoxygalactose transaminase